MPTTFRTKRDILRQAIHQAEKNGWDSHFKAHDIPQNYRHVLGSLLDKFYMHLLLDHSFAKAFWGNDYPFELKVDMVPSGPGDMPAWKFFLGEMARKDDPVAYIGQFIKKDAEAIEPPKSDLDTAEKLEEELEDDDLPLEKK